MKFFINENNEVIVTEMQSKKQGSPKRLTIVPNVALVAIVPKKVKKLQKNLILSLKKAKKLQNSLLLSLKSLGLSIF